MQTNVSVGPAFALHRARVLLLACQVGLVGVSLFQPALVDALDAPAGPNAPRTVEEIPCVPPPPFELELLRPKKDWRPPDFESVKKLLEVLQAQAVVDPQGLCRYRAANHELRPEVSRRVVFMGDSITEGWKAAAPRFFTTEVLNRGIAGQNTSQMVLRFREDVLDLHPKVVHILAGINDINSPAGTSLTQSNLITMVELAKSHGITVILGALTPSLRFWTAPGVRPAPQIDNLNRWIRKFASTNRVLYIDYFNPLVDAQNGFKAELSNDGLHPNQRGYDIMTPLAEHAIAIALDSGDR